MPTVYILHSKDLNRFYIGFTTDLIKRLFHHENPESRKFTAKAKDWAVFLEIECETDSQGLSIEKHMKKMKSRVFIENLIQYPEIIERLKEKYS